MSIYVSAADINFNNFFIICCPQQNFATCLNKTVDKPFNGLSTIVELTNLTAATTYNVSVYTMLSNGFLSTAYIISGCTGKYYEFKVF